MADPFDTADRYTCDDDPEDGCLCCETVEQAIEEHLESLIGSEDDPVSTIREFSPIMVTAWKDQRHPDDAENMLTLVGEREFTAEQVEAMMREQRPEWFEVEDG